MNGLAFTVPDGSVLQRWTRPAEFLLYLVPVGGLSGPLFAKYASLVVQNAQIPINSLTKPGGYAPELSPFRSFSWDNNDASLRFRFVSSLQNVEPVDGEEVHAWFRPIGILGICHCPSTPNLKQAYDQFLVSVKHFPGMVVQKMFAFDHDFDDLTGLQETQKLTELVMFPMLQQLENGQSTVTFHLQVVLDNIAVTIFMSLESCLRAAMRNASGNVNSNAAIDGDFSNTLLDTSVEPSHGSSSGYRLNAASSTLASALLFTTSPATAIASTTASADSRNRKRLVARQRKLFGDYCVLVNCMPDALDHYVAAMDLLREEEKKSSISLGGASASSVYAGDCLWLAAAIEGYVFCLYAESQDKFQVEIVEKTSEALVYYAKAGCHEMQSMLIENIGWYYVGVANWYACSGQARGKDKLEESLWIKRLISEVILRGLLEFGSVSLSRQVHFLLQSARMLESIGHRRHMALFLHEAASVLVAQNVYDPVSSPSSSRNLQREKDLKTALALERLAAMRLGLLLDEKEITDNATRVVAMKKPSGTAQSWSIIRFHVLRQLVTISKLLGDTLLVGKFALELLRLLIECDSSRFVEEKKSTGANENALMSSGVQIDQCQVPFSSNPALYEAVTSPAGYSLGFVDRHALHLKPSAYWTPPPSIEIKAKRYFSLAASPTVSSAAATFSSTSGRLLATPRQQFNAAVNAFSTKASPFGRSTSSTSSYGSTTPSPVGAGATSAAFNEAINPIDNCSIRSSASNAASNGDDGPNMNGGELAEGTSEPADPSTSVAAGSAQTGGTTTPPATELTQFPQHHTIEFSFAPWNLRSRQDILKMQKRLLTVLQFECDGLRPSTPSGLPMTSASSTSPLWSTSSVVRTFLRVNKLSAVLSTENNGVLSQQTALQLYGCHPEAMQDPSVSSGDSKPTFFYNPFEKKTRNDQKEHNKPPKMSTTNDSVDDQEDDDEEEAAISPSGYERGFPVDELVEVLLEISNPLGMKIDVHQATLYATVTRHDGNGPSADQQDTKDTANNHASKWFECYPLSFSLGAYETRKRLVLTMRPLVHGELQILGVFLPIGNLKMVFRLQKPRILTIISKLPLLVSSMRDPILLSTCGGDNSMESSETSTAAAATATVPFTAGPQTLHLFLNEKKRFLVQIRNVGMLSIEHCRVGIQSTERSARVLGSTKQQVAVFDNLFDKTMPAKKPFPNEILKFANGVTLRWSMKSPVEQQLCLPFGVGETRTLAFEVEWRKPLENLSGASKPQQDDPPQSMTLEWCFTYAASSGKDITETMLYRETKMQLRVQGSPSLSLSQVWFAPIHSRASMTGVNASQSCQQVTNDQSTCLVVFEITNPAQTSFFVRVAPKSNASNASEKGINARAEANMTEIPPSSTRRLVVEVPRIKYHELPTRPQKEDANANCCDGTAGSIALTALQHQLVWQWQTRLGSVGELDFVSCGKALKWAADSMLSYSEPCVRFKCLPVTNSTATSCQPSNREPRNGNPFDDDVAGSQLPPCLSIGDGASSAIVSSSSRVCSGPSCCRFHSSMESQNAQTRFYFGETRPKRHRWQLSSGEFYEFGFEMAFTDANRVDQQVPVDIETHIHVLHPEQSLGRQRSGAHEHQPLENVLVAGPVESTWRFLPSDGRRQVVKHVISCAFLCRGDYEISIWACVQPLDQIIWCHEPFCIQVL